MGEGWGDAGGAEVDGQALEAVLGNTVQIPVLLLPFPL